MVLAISAQYFLPVRHHDEGEAPAFPSISRYSRESCALFLHRGLCLAHLRRVISGFLAKAQWRLSAAVPTRHPLDIIQLFPAKPQIFYDLQKS